MALWQDTRFAFRQLRTSSGFTLTVLLTLGLCIGANTAVYTLVDGVLLRPAPYPEPDRLAVLGVVFREGGMESVEDSLTGAQFEALRSGAPALDVAAYGVGGGANFVSGRRVEFIQQQRVSTGYFHVLGVPPQIGREFSLAEDTAGGPAVAVLSYPFWQRVFHGDRSIVGRSIDLRGEPYTVVGIMPRGFRTETPADVSHTFRTEAPADVWTPLRPSRTGEGAGSNYGVIARLRPGVSWAEAAAQVQSLGAALANQQHLPPGASYEERLIPFQRGMAASVRSELLLTWGAVLVVLLIGCVNISGLLLARSVARSREIATRMALGGGRGAIVRAALVESLLLALGGGALGLLIGQFALDGLKSLGASSFELWHPLTLDARVLAATFGLALLTSLVFGLLPAIRRQPGGYPQRSGGRRARPRGRRTAPASHFAGGWRGGSEPGSAGFRRIAGENAGLPERAEPGLRYEKCVHRSNFAAGRALPVGRERPEAVSRWSRTDTQDSRGAVGGGGADLALRAAAE